MKIIVKKSTGKVLHVAQDVDVIFSELTGIRIGDLVYPSLSKANCFILENETLPTGYNIETLAFINGIYVDLNALELAKRDKLHELKELFNDVYDAAKLTLSEYFLTGEAVPLGIKNKIALVKQKRAEIAAEINLLKTVESVLGYPLPYDQAEKFKERLSQI